MMKRFYVLTRDLHLYIGLFISPFVLVFAVSVPFLVHSLISGVSQPDRTRMVNNLSLPADLGRLNGREQLNGIRKVLDQIGIKGEVGFIRYLSKEHRLIVPVMVPGHETTADLSLTSGAATISERNTGLADAIVYLHKMPGPHNANIRGNSFYMSIWRWLADATVYLVLFLSVSGVYLWAVLKAERRVGLSLLAAGAFSFFGLIYALSSH
jgi:hypothetical protein